MKTRLKQMPKVLAVLMLALSIMCVCFSLMNREAKAYTVIPPILRIEVSATGSATKTYNGSMQSCTATLTYTCSDSGFNKNNVVFRGSKTVSGKNVDNYSLTLNAKDFEYKDERYTAEFVIKSSNVKLTINPKPIDIDVYGQNDITKVYNGYGQSVTGSVWAYCGESGFNVDRFSYNGTRTVSGKNAGNYTVQLKTGSCSYNDPNYDPTFNIKRDINLTITKAPLTIRVDGSHGSFVYNGKSQTYTGTVSTTKIYDPQKIFDASKFKYNGTKTVSGTNITSYSRSLFASNCSYDDNKNCSVTWTIGDPIKLDIKPFSDAVPGSYYYEAAKWARESGIFTGTKLSPDEAASRGEVVTVLYNLMGKPQLWDSAKDNPFTDVSSNNTPVLWAYYSNPQITNGTSSTTFSPTSSCTRAQVVTFLWRYMGCPQVGTVNLPFTDIKTNGYYYDALKWAYSKNIVSGTSLTTFSPDNNCTHAMMLTLVYRMSSLSGCPRTPKTVLNITINGSSKEFNYTGNPISYKGTLSFVCSNSGYSASNVDTSAYKDEDLTVGPYTNYGTYTKSVVNKCKYKDYRYNVNWKIGTPITMNNTGACFINTFDELMSKTIRIENRDVPIIGLIFARINADKYSSSPIKVNGVDYNVFTGDKTILIKTDVLLSYSHQILQYPSDSAIKKGLQEAYRNGTTKPLDQYFVYSSGLYLEGEGLYTDGYSNFFIAQVQHSLASDGTIKTHLVDSIGVCFKVSSNRGLVYSDSECGTIIKKAHTNWLFLVPIYTANFETGISNDAFLQKDGKTPYYIDEVQFIAKASKSSADRFPLVAKALFATFDIGAKAWSLKKAPDASTVCDLIEAVRGAIDLASSNEVETTFGVISLPPQTGVDGKTEYKAVPTLQSPMALCRKDEYVKFRIGFTGNSNENLRKLMEIGYESKCTMNCPIYSHSW